MAIPSGYSLVKTQYGSWATCPDGDKFRAVAQVYARDNGTGYDLYLRRYIEVSTVTSAGYAGTIVALGWTYNGNKSVTINYTGNYAIVDYNWCTRAYGASEPVREADAYGTYTSYGGTKYYSHAGFTYTVPYPTYTVTYNANGGSGSMASQTATYNHAFLTRKNTFTRTGHTFNGWNEAANGTGVVWGLTSTGVYEYGVSWTWTYRRNITLYAQWVPNTYYVYYNANGGSGAPSTQSYTYSSSGTINLSSSIPTRKGYTFLGWSTSSSATSASYGAGSAWSRGNAASYTLYAVWSPNKIKITLAKNGGSGGTSAIWYYFNTNKYYSNEACTTEITSVSLPSKTGYSFVNYTGDGSAGGNNGEQYIYTAGTFASDLCTDISSNATLTAQWTANTYTITYNANGGSGVPSNQTYTYASSGTINLSNTVPTRTGYKFLGWSTSSSATSASYGAGSAYNKNNASNVTLYAVWQQIKNIGISFSNTTYSITNNGQGKAQLTTLSIPFTLTNVDTSNNNENFWIVASYTVNSSKIVAYSGGPFQNSALTSKVLPLSASVVSSYLQNTNNTDSINMVVEVYTAVNNSDSYKTTSSFSVTINNYTKPLCKILTAHRILDNDIVVKAQITYPACYTNLTNVIPSLKWGETTLSNTPTKNMLSTNVYQYDYIISNSSVGGENYISISYSDNLFESIGKRRVAATAADQIFKIVKSSGICYAFEFIEN